MPKGGTHVRTFLEHAEDDKSIGRLTVQIWPIPSSTAPALSEAIQEAVNNVLTAAGVTTGNVTNLRKDKLN